jgi:hypothetical protein
MKLALASPLALAVTALALFSGPASAAPFAPGKPAIDAPTEASQVQYRRHGGYGGRGYYGRRNGNGLGIGLGIAGAVIGGAIIAGESRRRYYSNDEYYDSGSYGSARCAAAFRSYDSDTGTYTGYDGETHRCPYL